MRQAGSMRRVRRVGSMCVAMLLCGHSPALHAQPAPPAPEIRAVHLSTPLKVDGILDESLYAEAAPFSNFIQTEPVANAPATEKTELWVAFDHAQIYICFRVWESHPERMVVNEM